MADELTILYRQGLAKNPYVYVGEDGVAAVKVAMDTWSQGKDKKRRLAAMHYAKLFERFGDTREVLPRTRFKQVEGTELWEFKDTESQTRLLGFYADGGFVLHYVIVGKKEDKLNPGDVSRAQIEMQSYERRKKVAVSTAEAGPRNVVGIRRGAKK